MCADVSESLFRRKNRRMEDVEKHRCFFCFFLQEICRLASWASRFSVTCLLLRFFGVTVWSISACQSVPRMFIFPACLHQLAAVSGYYNITTFSPCSVRISRVTPRYFLYDFGWFVICKCAHLQCLYVGGKICFYEIVCNKIFIHLGILCCWVYGSPERQRESD